MKNITLALAATLLSSSMVFACPGGNLLQVVNKNDAGQSQVIANYSITTGELLNLRDGFTITSIINEISGESLCQDEDCSKLVDINNENIIVHFSSSSRVEGSVAIENVSTGANSPVAKGMPVPASPGSSIDPLQLMSCSKK